MTKKEQKKLLRRLPIMTKKRQRQLLKRYFFPDGYIEALDALDKALSRARGLKGALTRLKWKLEKLRS